LACLEPLTISILLTEATEGKGRITQQCQLQSSFPKADVEAKLVQMHISRKLNKKRHWREKQYTACTLVSSECGAFPFHTLVEDVVYSTMYFTGTWVKWAACVQLN
jgi:hypothetical protein